MGELRPICANCKVEMECVRNEVAVWHPMEPIKTYGTEVIDFVVIGDRYKCTKCGANIVTGFGKMLVATNHEQNYLRKIRDGMEERIRVLR